MTVNRHVKCLGIFVALGAGISVAVGLVLALCFGLVDLLGGRGAVITVSLIALGLLGVATHLICKDMG